MALRVDLGADGTLSLAFNQDCSCCCVADFSGIRIWNLAGAAPACVLDLPLGAVSVARMLYCTSLVAFVGAGEQPHLSPRKLTLLNSHSNSVIQSLSFPGTVLGVYLNRRRLVAVLERRALVYDLESLQLLSPTLDTEPNPGGLAALTSGSGGNSSGGGSGGGSTAPCLLALPAGGGAVRVYDCGRGAGVEALCELEAHKTPVAAMAWDEEGCLLATASRKGTVVRVHAVRHSEERALEFRRGSTPATITCLAFSPPSVAPRLLCCASDHGTVHLFQLQAPGRHPAAAAAKVLLKAVMPALEPQRPLASIRLPGKGGHRPSICALRQEAAEGSSGEGEGSGAPVGPAVGADRETRLVVATGEGLLYCYRLELPESGSGGGGGSGGVKCSLEGEWSLRHRQSGTS